MKAPSEFTVAQIDTDPILQYFGYSHLPFPLQEISSAFCSLAAFLVDATPRSAERSAGLRKLLEAKDCAVRSSVGSGEVATNFRTRLVAEEKELANRLGNLYQFIGSPTFNALPAIEQTALRDQHEIMRDYCNILRARISRLPTTGQGETRVVGEVKTTGGGSIETPVDFKA